MGILEMDFERILGVTFFISSSHSIMLCLIHIFQPNLSTNIQVLGGSKFEDFVANNLVDVSNIVSEKIPGSIFVSEYITGCSKMAH